MQRPAPNSGGIAARIRSDAARKPTVLAIHGTAGSGRQWQALAERLEGAAQVIALGLWRNMTEVISGNWAIPQHRCRGPLAIHCGQLAPPVTAAMARQIARVHPGASVSVLPGLGHFAPPAQSETVKAHVLSALSRCGVAVKCADRWVIGQAA